MKGCEYCKNCKNKNCSLGYTADNGFNNTNDITKVYPPCEKQYFVEK